MKAQNAEPLDWRFVDGRRRFRLTLVALLVLLICVSGIGRRFGGWPIVSWPMYSRKDTPFPAVTEQVVELRVGNGTRVFRVFAPIDFLPMGSTAPIREVFEGAFSSPDTVLRDQYRSYVVSVLKRTMPAEEMQTIQGWRLVWTVNPREVPPMDRARPANELALGSFTASDYSRNPVRGR